MEKSEKSGNFTKTFIFLFLICFKLNNTLCIQMSSKKYWFLKTLEHFQFIRVWPWKNGPKCNDVIGGHVRGPKFENLFFHTLEWIFGILTQTAKKKKFHRFISNWNCSGHIVPSPKANRVKLFNRKPNTLHYLYIQEYVFCLSFHVMLCNWKHNTLHYHFIHL